MSFTVDGFEPTTGYGGAHFAFHVTPARKKRAASVEVASATTGNTRMRLAPNASIQAPQTSTGSAPAAPAAAACVAFPAAPSEFWAMDDPNCKAALDTYTSPPRLQAKLPHIKAKRLEVYKAAVGQFLSQFRTSAEGTDCSVKLTTSKDDWKPQWERELRELYGARVMVTDEGVFVVDLLVNKPHEMAINELKVQFGVWPRAAGVKHTVSQGGGRIEHGSRPMMEPDHIVLPNHGRAFEAGVGKSCRPRVIVEVEDGHRGQDACRRDFLHYFNATAGADAAAAAAAAAAGAAAPSPEAELTRMVIVIKFHLRRGAAAATAAVAAAAAGRLRPLTVSVVAWKRNPANHARPHAIEVFEALDCGDLPLPDTSKKAWSKTLGTSALPPVPLGRWGNHIAPAAATLTVPADALLYESYNGALNPQPLAAANGDLVLDLREIMRAHAVMPR